MTPRDAMGLKTIYLGLPAVAVRKLAAELAAGDPVAAVVCAALKTDAAGLEAHAAWLVDAEAEAAAESRRRGAA